VTPGSAEYNTRKARMVKIAKASMAVAKVTGKVVPASIRIALW
jgi:hypothetical protein